MLRWTEAYSDADFRCFAVSWAKNYWSFSCADLPDHSLVEECALIAQVTFGLLSISYH